MSGFCQAFFVGRGGLRFGLSGKIVPFALGLGA
jgi:hypothetical protein